MSRQLVAVVKKWAMKIDFLHSWFARWYEKQSFDPEDSDDILEQRQLLFPCKRFNHAQGFATATRFLAYNTFGHITENNPSDFGDLRLPHRIISLLNAAKGRLRTILHRDLYKPKIFLLEAKCKCKGDTFWGYEKALCDTRAWPPEKVESSTSMAFILERLEKFEYKPAATACIPACHQNYQAAVRSARVKTERYFDGMCLDCMERLNPKLRDHNEDYWAHNDFRAEDSWFPGLPHRAQAAFVVLLVHGAGKRTRTICRSGTGAMTIRIPSESEIQSDIFTLRPTFSPGRHFPFI